MSEHLGRPIERGEIIHHIDTDKTNNKIENLYLCSNNSEHGKVHRSINKLIKPLLEKGIIIFDNGKYILHGG